jgi:hypothetical protein
LVVVKLLPLRHVADLLSVNAAVGLGLTVTDLDKVSAQLFPEEAMSLMEYEPELA